MSRKQEIRDTKKGKFDDTAMRECRITQTCGWHRLVQTFFSFQLFRFEKLFGRLFGKSNKKKSQKFNNFIS